MFYVPLEVTLILGIIALGLIITVTVLYYKKWKKQKKD